MFKNKLNIIVLGTFAIALFTIKATPSAFAATNLIKNADLTAHTISSSSPDYWNQGHFGTSTASFSYPVVGPTASDTAVQVTLSNYTSGDAKWYFQNVPVTPGATYQFSDSYNSGAASYLVAQFTPATGTATFQNLATLGATTGWITATQSFIAPTNATSVTIFHLIQSAGTLKTAKFSLVLTAPPTPTSTPSNGNLILNANLKSDTITPGIPDYWNQGHFGTSTASFSYPATGPSATDTAVQVTLSNYTSGDAKWYFQDVPVGTSTAFIYSDSFNATAPNIIQARFTMNDNSVSYVTLDAFPGTTGWAKSSDSFSVPANAKSVTVFHFIPASGTLTTADYSLIATTTFGSAGQTGNLIANPDLKNNTIVSTMPDYWYQGGFGTSTRTFTYPAAGPAAGDKAVQVTLSNYTSGDGKWYFKSVPVFPGAGYTYSDEYNSPLKSYLIAQFTLGDGSLLYVPIVESLASTTGWATVTQTFTAPYNASSVTIFHLIQGNGTLTTTHYSLALTTPASQNLFTKGLVSLTFDDGWASQYRNALPILQAAKIPATFYIITNPMKDQNELAYPGGSNPVANVDVSTTTQSITWGDLSNGDGIYGDPIARTFTFSDTYKSTAQSTITADYRISDAATGNTVYKTGTVTVGTLPAAPNGVNSAKLNFVIPEIVGLADATTTVEISITQTVTTGTLTTSNVLVTQKADYMNSQQIVALSKDGEEIGDHTQSHPELGAMSDASVTLELIASRAQLLELGLNCDVNSFAYPEGSYTQFTEQLVNNAGFVSGRSIISGYNSRSNDHMLLNSQLVLQNTTFAQVQPWIDWAANNRLWLILVFHQVESSSTLSQLGETGGTTPQVLQQITSYLQSKQQAGTISVKTVQQAMAQMNY
jgi:peptidoglycan/xylan/chitin deacetylase (PgdA/CDA1 family)